MDISALLHDDVNVIDIYICPRGATVDGDWANIIGWEKPAPTLPTFGTSKGTPQHFLEYHHRELCYVYDTANDGQRVLQKKVIASSSQRPFVAYAYQEDQLPPHKFPCVSEVTHKQEIERTTYRINNRLFFIVDVEKEGENTWTYYYVRYQHAPNVDTKKLEDDLRNVLKQCKRTFA